jgi:DnaJ-class molecular chaperone
MAEVKDYYKILGVRRDASQADIQKAYRDLAKKYHPDRNPDDKDAAKRFRQIQSAFDVLNDPEKREMYDRYGSSFETRRAGGPQGPYSYTGRPGAGGPQAGSGFEDVDFGQFFGERFGAEPAGGFAEMFRQFSQGAGPRRRGRAGGAGPRGRGADAVHQIQIPFTTAVAGGTVEVAVGRATGAVQTLSVKIPAGIDDGKRIRLRAQGEPGPGGGPPGDLLLEVRVDPHPCYDRRGDNLLVRVPVRLEEALDGAKIDIPTPQGTVALHVPPGTSSGTKLRVKGHGVAREKGAPGDLLAEIQIVLPKQIDPSVRETIRQLSLKYPADPRANLRW